MKKRTVILSAGVGSLLVFIFLGGRANQNANRATKDSPIQIPHNSRIYRETTLEVTDHPIPSDLHREHEERSRDTSVRASGSPHLLGPSDARKTLAQAMVQARVKSLRSLDSSAMSLPASMVISDQQSIPDSQEEHLIQLAQQFQKDVGEEITLPRTDTLDANQWLDTKEQSDLQFRIRYGKQAWLSHHIAAQHLLLDQQKQ